MKNLLHALLFSALLLSGFAQSETLKPEVPVNAKKPTIIALAPHIVEMLYDIGAGDQIIGTTDFADYPEQAKAIPRIGNYAKLQIEKGDAKLLKAKGGFDPKLNGNINQKYFNVSDSDGIVIDAHIRLSYTF